ncbi:MAG TPA: transporter substrate-binding domain-containing protein [bacterium]|nr:transporter substrate-binding domain-containing protein [bacterium]
MILRRTPRVRAALSRAAIGAAALLLTAACAPRTAVQGPPPLPPAPHPAAQGPAVAAVQRAGKLRVAVDLSVPPMAFRDASGPAGFDVDLIGLIARSLGVSGEITDMPSAAMRGAFPANEDLAAGALSAGMVPGAATEAYETASQTIVWRAGTRGSTLQELRGKRVAVSLGRPGERLARGAGATLVPTYLPEESLAMVGDGRVDAAIADGPEALGFVSGRSGLRTSAAGGPAASFVMVARPGAGDLAAYVSAVIQELRSRGGLEQLRRRWHL